MSRNEVVALGVSFKTAPLAVRERLAIGPEAAPEALQYLRRYADEAFILSTCNRAEIYLAGPDIERASFGASSLFGARSGLALHDLADCVTVTAGESAAVHLLEVAAGMDSLVLGEHEILTQIRRSCQIAQVAGSLGPILSRLTQTALKTGKRARTETAIGRHATSVSLAAVRLAQEVCGDLRERTAIVVGAGMTANLVAQALRDQKTKQIHIASRRISAAQELAQPVGAHAWDMSAIPSLLASADVLVSCTGAPNLVLSGIQVAMAQLQREGRPLLLIDLAVPRDIDPAVREFPGVVLYDMDDLRMICERNQAARKQALKEVVTIIREEALGFCNWQQERDAVAAVAALRTWAEDMRQAELAKTLRKLGHLAPEQQQAVSALSEAIINKLLHPPTVYLKAQESHHAHRVVHAVFGLPSSGGIPDGGAIREILATPGERVSHA